MIANLSQPSYQLPTPYGCREIARTRFFFSNSRSLWQGQRSNQGQKMTLHTDTPQPMSLPSMNFLYCPPACPSRHHMDTNGEINTPTALKDCGVKHSFIIAIKLSKQNQLSFSYKMCINNHSLPPLLLVSCQ